MNRTSAVICAFLLTASLANAQSISIDQATPGTGTIAANGKWDQGAGNQFAAVQTWYRVSGTKAWTRAGGPNIDFTKKTWAYTYTNLKSGTNYDIIVTLQYVDANMIIQTKDSTPVLNIPVK
jgi:hypothetical protein